MAEIIKPTRRQFLKGVVLLPLIAGRIKPPEPPPVCEVPAATTESHDPIVGSAWNPPGEWRVVNFRTTEPGYEAFHQERKLLANPSDQVQFFGGGSSWGWQADCNNEAEAGYRIDQLDPINLVELINAGLAIKPSDEQVPPAEEQHHKPVVGGTWTPGRSKGEWLNVTFWTPEPEAPEEFRQQEHKLFLLPGQTSVMLKGGGAAWSLPFEFGLAAYEQFLQMPPAQVGLDRLIELGLANFPTKEGGNLR